MKISYGGWSIGYQFKFLCDKKSAKGVYEGVNRLGDRRVLVLARDPIFVFLGVHTESFDDTQNDVDDVAIVHGVACRACVGCADDEACCEGLEAVGGMPVGGHPLTILFVIFGCCFAILRDETVEHV